jgi:DNA polymerase III epsilon subunit-like protein
METIYDRIYFYDLETTELSTNRACILECFIINWTGTRYRHWYIYPSDGKKIQNSFIHRIDENVLRQRGAIQVGQFMEEMEEFLQNNSCSGTGIDTGINQEPIYLIAHNNNRYDKLVLQEEYRRMGRRMPENWNHKDSLVHFRELYPRLGMGKYKLGELYNTYKSELGNNIEEGSLHSADVDTRILRELYRTKIANRFETPEQFMEYFMGH